MAKAQLRPQTNGRLRAGDPYPRGGDKLRKIDDQTRGACYGSQFDAKTMVCAGGTAGGKDACAAVGSARCGVDQDSHRAVDVGLGEVGARGQPQA